MNKKAPRFCKHPGCNALVFTGYCDQHQAKQAQAYKDSQRSYNDRRAETDRLYKTEKWRKLSVRFRKLNPLCVECERKGLVRHADLVDHIKPVKEHPELFHDWRNLRSLCQRCHNEIGAKVRA